MEYQEQMKVLYEIFDASLPRLGVGDEASTLRALNILLGLREQNGSGSQADGLRILDVGCGNGAQTLQLARSAEGNIVALDNHPPFLAELERRARAENLWQKISSRCKDMRLLGEEDGQFDVVWAEGSLYVVGFRAGLEACVRRLADGGAVAASELVWLRSDRPAECQAFFDAEYPAMGDLVANETLISDCGLRLVERFLLPESAWWTEYYHPLEDRLELLRSKYAAHPGKLAMVEEVQTEIDMYRRFAAFYGYAFFLME